MRRHGSVAADSGEVVDDQRCYLVGILASQAVRSASQDVEKRCSGAAQQAAGQSKDESRHATGSEVVIDGAVSA
jgi:hypothetical protein